MALKLALLDKSEVVWKNLLEKTKKRIEKRIEEGNREQSEGIQRKGEKSIEKQILAKTINWIK